MPQTGTETALNYVRKRREEGISDQQIARELREADWDDETIEDLLRRAESHDGERIEADTSAEQTVSETPMETWKKVVLLASSFMFFPVALVWGILYLASDVSPDRKTIGKWAVGISLLMLVVVIAMPTEEEPKPPAEEAAVEIEEPEEAAGRDSQETEHRADAPKKDVADAPQPQANTSDTARQESAEHSTPEEAKPQTQGPTSAEAPHSTTPDHDKTEAWVIAQQFVENNLKSPGTADFGSVWDGDWQSSDDCVEYLGDGKYRAKGWVDAENEFGATVRIDFTLELEHVPGDKWRCNSHDLEQRK